MPTLRNIFWVLVLAIACYCNAESAEGVECGYYGFGQTGVYSLYHNQWVTNNSTGLLGICMMNSFKGQSLSTSGEWVAVCQNKITLGGASAACRQLGHISATSITGMQTTQTDIRYALNLIHCPDTEDFSIFGELHIMRCQVGTLVPASECDNLASIVCNSTKLTDNSVAYNGQVRLLSTESILSKGNVQMYWEDEWHDVCYNNFSKTIVDSLCRQLGYTGMISVDEQSFSSRMGISLGEFSNYCHTSSQPCHTNCLTPEDVETGMECTTFEIACEYDTSVSALYSAGSRKLCIVEQTSGVDYLTGFYVVLGLHIPSLLLIFVFACLLVKHWKRRGKVSAK